MHTLRLTQFVEGENRHRAEVASEDVGGTRQSAVSHFEFAVSEQKREDVRWYLEHFLQYPLDPAPKIAARIEDRTADTGRDLFERTFHSNRDASDLWATLRSRVNDARVGIVSDLEGATAIPWEFLRDPKTDVGLALHAILRARAPKPPGGHASRGGQRADSHAPGPGQRPNGLANVPQKRSACRRRG